MRKLLTLMAVLAVVLTTGSTTASAQATINLNGSASTLSFLGESSPTHIGFTLGALCPNSSVCGANQSGGGAVGFYDITGSPTITLTFVSVTQWSVTQSGPLTISFCSTVDCGGGGNITYLTGTMNLVNLLQAGAVGVHNYTEDANLTVTGGTLPWTSKGISVIDLSFTSVTNLASLLNSSSSVTGLKVSGGTIDPTPEPTSILLFGSGLLALGGILRWRLRTIKPYQATVMNCPDGR